MLQRECSIISTTPCRIAWKVGSAIISFSLRTNILLKFCAKIHFFQQICNFFDFAGGGEMVGSCQVVVRQFLDKLLVSVWGLAWNDYFLTSTMRHPFHARVCASLDFLMFSSGLGCLLTETIGMALIPKYIRNGIKQIKIVSNTFRQKLQ